MRTYDKGGRIWRACEWTNEHIVALGAVLTADLEVTRIPAGMFVTRCAVRIVSAAVGPTTLTGSVGRTGPSYIDYIVARSLKTAPPAGFGLAAADLGSRMSDLLGDMPSLSNQVSIFMHLIATGGNLNTVTGSSGIVYLELSNLG